jgi:glycerol kinase
VSLLVIDVGTTGLRALIVRPDSSIAAERYERLPPTSPFPGAVEFDPVGLADKAIELAIAVLREAGPVSGVGIANQRASTVVWDAATGLPVGPGIGWQDLRTVGTCIMLGAQGLRLGPNQSATKIAYLLDTFDPDRSRDLRFGTVDTWLAWRLTAGAVHITDASNAAISGVTEVVDGDPASMLPEIVDSVGQIAPCSVLPGAPLLAGIAGDQQASLLGQGCVHASDTKITFGTGAMLDTCLGMTPPERAARHPGGTFPIAAWRHRGVTTWGIEAIMLSAGTAVDWLREDLGILDDVAESDALARSIESTGDVWFVPALLGLGTPHWDYGARGTLLGLTRGSGRAEVVRAVLEGIAHRGADLVDAAEEQGGLKIGTLRVDGGMSANGFFVQALADATQRPVEVAPVKEATSLGAAYLAGLADGTWGSFSDIAAAWKPSARVEPGAPTQRERWFEARERSRGWLPDFSALDF